MTLDDRGMAATTCILKCLDAHAKTLRQEKRETPPQEYIIHATLNAELTQIKHTREMVAGIANPYARIRGLELELDKERKKYENLQASLAGVSNTMPPGKRS